MRRPAFTLIELLLVIGIIGIISAIVIIAINPQKQFLAAKDMRRNSYALQLRNALTQYLIDNGAFPNDGTIFVGTEAARPICKQGVTSDASCVNLDALTPKYLASLPQDTDEPCSNFLGFKVHKNTAGPPTVLPMRLGQANPYCLWNGLIGYWKFSEGAGTTTFDFSGKSNTGTLINNPTWTTGKIGNAIQFTTSNNSYVTVTVSPSFPLDGLHESYALWAKHSGSDYLFANVWNRRLFGTIWVFVDTANNYYYPAATGANDGNWHLITATLADRVLTTYVDGVQVGAPITMANNLPGIYTTFNMGRVCSGNDCEHYFTGALDDIRIYNRTLSPTEVAALAAGSVD